MENHDRLLPAVGPKIVPAAMGEVRLTRSYKVVRINDESGNVISVKHRFFAASE